MYLHINGYKVEGREIIDVSTQLIVKFIFFFNIFNKIVTDLFIIQIPYWMHVAFLQVMHLVYLDDDIMLSEMIEELTRPRLKHKNAKSMSFLFIYLLLII